MEPKWTVLANTTLGTLLATVDGSILIISLPVVFRGVGVDPFLPQNFPLLIWILLGYGIVTATLLVTFGRLSDMWGRARMYNLGFAVFAFGSVLLFLTPHHGVAGAEEIVVFRLVQGVGAAFLFSNSAALITDAFPRNERGRALGINNVTASVGYVAGLVIGGLLAGVPDIALGPFVLETWRLIFLVSVPVSVVGALWAYFKLRETATIRRGQRIDWLGNATFAAGLTILLAAATFGLLPYGGQPMGWANPAVWGGLVLGAALLVSFVALEGRTPDPMFRLDLLRIRAFGAGNAAGFLAALARGGLMFLLTIWLQGVWLPLHGYAFEETPLWAGFAVAPMMVGLAVLGPISGWLSDRFGARYLASAGVALSSAALLGLLLLPYDFAYLPFGALLLLFGSGLGMFASPNASAVMSSVPAEHRGVASGMRATLMNVGQQLSLAVFFTVLILGFSAGLAGSLGAQLGAAGVGPADAHVLVGALANNPTGAIFAAFLGENPMGTLLRGLDAAHPPGWTPLPPAVAANLTSQRFFPLAIGPSFARGIDVALAIGFACTLGACVASLLRGAHVPAEAWRERGPPSLVAPGAGLGPDATGRLGARADGPPPPNGGA